MAQGDVVFFDQFLVDANEGLHDLEADTVKVGLVDNVTVPAATTADPRWGAGGTTNFKTNEVTPGGNYAVNGFDITTGASVTLTGGAAIFDSTDNPTWAQNASNPTDATWGIIYNDTTAGKQAVGYVDLGGAFNMTTGDLTITWNATGIFSLDQA